MTDDIPPTEPTPDPLLLTEPVPAPPAAAAGLDWARFILWTGAFLTLVLAGARLAIIRGDLAGHGIGEAARMALSALWQDGLVVLALVGIALSLRMVTGGGRIVGGLAALVAVVLAIWAVANITAVRMLGAPLSIDWLRYSDVTRTDVIFDSLRRIVTPAQIAGVLALIVGLPLGAAWAARRPSRRVPMAVLGALAVAVIGGAALSTGTTGVTQVRRANPALVFMASVLGPRAEDGIADLGAGRPETLRAPVGIAPQLARPARPAKPIRNVVIFAFESTPSKYAEGFEGTLPVTPNLRAALPAGLRFTNAYAHVPASNYFLVSIFGGIVPELSADSMTNDPERIDLVTIADVLGTAGMRTGFFNSSDNRFQNTEGFVRAAGFGLVKDYRDWTCETGVYAHESITHQFLNTSSDLCTVDKITDWIGAAPDAPFFAAFRTGMTHHPYFPGESPEPLADDPVMNDYLNALKVGDQAFGRLMDYLNESGLAEETLVVVLGDHGEAFGEHGTYVHAAGLNEENIHVPLALINPQLFDGGSSDLIVGISDIAPTITDLLGLPTPPGWQGKSVFAADRPDGVFFFSPWNGFLIGYREGDRKYIYNGNTREAWLYDLAEDPQEQRNLVEERPEDAAMARVVLGDWVAMQEGFIDWLASGSALERKPPPAQATEVVVVASGSSFQNPPKGWVMLDGAHVGGFDVTSAPSNAAAPVTWEQIEAGWQEYRLPVTPGPCPRQLELFFINDEWAGEGLSGDTDLWIREVRFGASTYRVNRFVTLHEGTGRVDGDHYVFWRKGGIRIDLEMESACVTEDLAAQTPE